MTDSFTLFIDKISMYPTVIFTGLVLFVTLYWLVSLLGVVDMDTVDLGGDMGGDIGGGDIAGDAGGDVSNMSDASTTGLFTSLMLKFGLYGVPLIVILTGISLLGWLLSYLYTTFLYNSLYTNELSPLLYYVFGTGALILVLVVSMWLTGLIIAPIRKKVAPAAKRNASSNIGKIATVRTLTVTDKHGEALLSDGGAGLILKVRQQDLADAKPLKQGDKVQLVEYVDEDNAYRVQAVRD